MQALNVFAAVQCTRIFHLRSGFWERESEQLESVIRSSSLYLYLTPTPASATSFEACHHGAYAQQWVSKCWLLTSCFIRGFGSVSGIVVVFRFKNFYSFHGFQDLCLKMLVFLFSFIFGIFFCLAAVKVCPHRLCRTRGHPQAG